MLLPFGVRVIQFAALAIAFDVQLLAALSIPLDLFQRNDSVVVSARVNLFLVGYCGAVQI